MAQFLSRFVGAAGVLPDVAQTRADVALLRPGLLERFDAAVPRARASVLGRLLGALDREPLPGLLSRHRECGSGLVRVTFAGGTEVIFATVAARPFATPETGLDQRSEQGRTVGRDNETDRPLLEAVVIADLGALSCALRPGAEPEDGSAPATSQHTTPTSQDTTSASQDTTAAWESATAAGRGAAVGIGDPAVLARILWPGAGLAAELDNSVANLALALAAQPDTDGPEWTLAGAEGDPGGLARLEQLVLDGHPLHPCCRTREGMTTADVLAYAPEHRPAIRLRKLAVPPDRWTGDGPPILYAHPWQAARLREEHPWLTDAGETAEGRPLMSLRTVALPGEHVKTAVDVRMTSAVRTVSPAAIHNGPRLSALLEELTRDLPLDMLAETGAGAVLVDGEPQRRMAHLRRAAPPPARDEALVPLGALKAGRPPLIRQAVERAGGDPYRWMVDLAAILWPSLMVVLDRGVALEAHGQNTLVGLTRGKPTRILYRDLGGVRVRRAEAVRSGLTGDLPCDDPAELRAKLAAACFGTVALEVVTLLAELHGADPLRLWGIIAESVERTGTKEAEAMLRDPLPLKATTAMRLAADPLDDVWCHLDNPMAGAR